MRVTPEFNELKLKSGTSSRTRSRCDDADDASAPKLYAGQAPQGAVGPASPSRSSSATWQAGVSVFPFNPAVICKPDLIWDAFG
jgi:hypothetical protein